MLTMFSMYECQYVIVHSQMHAWYLALTFRIVGWSSRNCSCCIIQRCRPMCTAVTHVNTVTFGPQLMTMARLRYDFFGIDAWSFRDYAHEAQRLCHHHRRHTSSTSISSRSRSEHTLQRAHITKRQSALQSTSMSRVCSINAIADTQLIVKYQSRKHGRNVHFDRSTSRSGMIVLTSKLDEIVENIIKFSIVMCACWRRGR